MQASDIPLKFNIPFASGAGGGFINYPIPQASQIGIVDGAASLTDGFPPDCFTPTGSGGVPPFGKDFNGVMKQSTSWDRWFSAGAPITYDATFQTAISGYPKGSIVQSATTFGLFWYSTIEGNVTNPDAAGAGWTGFNLANTVPGTGAYFQQLSTTSMQLKPTIGGMIWINGLNYVIPSSLTKSNAGLAANTNYYAYVFISSGVVTLEFSTTAYVVGSNGMPQKSGDVTRTCVGRFVTDGSAQFEGQGVGTMSYFNRRLIALPSNGAQSGNTNATSAAEISTSARATFMTWADEAVQISMIGYVSNNTASKACYSTLGLGNSVISNLVESLFGVAGSTSNVSQSIAVSTSEGQHFISPMGATDSGGQAQFAGLGCTAMVRC